MATQTGAVEQAALVRSAVSVPHCSVPACAQLPLAHCPPASLTHCPLLPTAAGGGGLCLLPAQAVPGVRAQPDAAGQEAAALPLLPPPSGGLPEGVHHRSSDRPGGRPGAQQQPRPHAAAVARSMRRGPRRAATSARQRQACTTRRQPAPADALHWWRLPAHLPTTWGLLFGRLEP